MIHLKYELVSLLYSRHYIIVSLGVPGEFLIFTSLPLELSNIPSVQKRDLLQGLCVYLSSTVSWQFELCFDS